MRRFRSINALLAAILLASTAVLASCSPDDPQNTLAAAAEVAQKQQDLFYFILGWGAVVFVLVEGLLVFTLIRFRRQNDDLPAQVHGNTKLEIGWTVVPALLMVVVIVPSVASIFDLADTPEISLEVNVIGHQWWWEFDYPGLGVVTANELHLPVGEAVALNLESADVIHAFWVPKLAGKQDAIPQRGNPMWLRADTPGVYYGQCAELCGVQHAQMALRVIVQTREEFDAWVRQQRAGAALAAGDLAGAQVFANPANQCIVCHTVQGVSAGNVGPDLTHVGSRRTIAAGVLENTPENLKEWITDPQAIKPGSLMTQVPLTEDQITQLVAYLQELK